MKIRGQSEANIDDRFGEIEKRGIDFIPLTERWAKPVNLFWMWGGAIFNVEILVYGAVLLGFGLSFAQAVVIICLGNLSYFLLGLTSLQGPEAGTTTFIINRASFGPRGSKLIAGFNWLTQVGFETEGLTLIVLAGVALAGKLGLSDSTPLKIVLIVLAAGIQLVLPLFGHQTILKTLKVLFFPFLVLFIALAAFTLHKVNVHGVHHGANWQTMFEGLAFILSASGLGWTENGNDYSRYLPRDVSKVKTTLWVFFGTFVPSVLLMILGAAVATYAGSASGSITGIASTLTPWFVWPYFIMVIVQLFAINSLDLYSSGVTLQALGLSLSRWKAVIVDTIVSTLLTVYALFAATFNTLLQEFILFIIVWVAPWTAIYLVDWYLRKMRYSAVDLQDTTSSGLYFSKGGIHYPAIIAQLLGMAAAMATIDLSPHYVSIISSVTNGADFSVFAGLIVGGFAYFILAGKSIRSQSNLAFNLDLERS